ncbi:MAG: Rieske 2Fe-2S domain-containing protein [Chloroflexi bacterium]|nr:Rieske 2Fe-2S domain-containing protein [Chloroflexota bacterium]GIW10726.1 MAG: hypothetical protein KatS3mg061_1783 [Dehalococcoidia bacterium]
MSERTVITPLDNGPYRVVGSFVVQLPSGRVLQQDGETYLCRCGGSNSKPFCDGTHRKIGFQAAEVPPAAASSEFVAVADEAAVPEDDLLEVNVNGQPVVLTRRGDQIYALSGICTHAEARLADGHLEGEVLFCPLHESGFDLRTGAPVRLPATEPLPVYQVRREGGKVLVSSRPVTP